MKRRLLFALPLLVLGCDKGGLYHFGVKTDTVEPCGPRSSVYLRSVPATSTEDGLPQTQILILGSADPLDPVPAPPPGTLGRCFLFGYVNQKSSTVLQSGTYELSGSGDGVVHVTASYVFDFEPQKPVGGRLGANRDDSVYDVNFGLGGTPSALALTFNGETHTMTSLSAVLDNVDVTTSTGPEDLFQVYNLALFLSQVRVPAFGGIGMTRYISSPSRFFGLVSGEFFVKVNSITEPTTTITYRESPEAPGIPFQDFPSIDVTGANITQVNISGDGPMDGVIDFVIHDSDDPSIVRFAGSVNYDMIEIRNGIAANGDYQLTVTQPAPATAALSYTLATNVDLTRILPPTP